MEVICETPACVNPCIYTRSAAKVHDIKVPTATLPRADDAIE